MISIANAKTGTSPLAAVIGLGSMGFGMAQSLMRAGFDVTGFDVASAAVDRLCREGSRAAANPADAAHGGDVIACVVVNAAQTEMVLFGPEGVGQSAKPGAVFISSATMDSVDRPSNSGEIRGDGTALSRCAYLRRRRARSQGRIDDHGVGVSRSVRRSAPRAQRDGGQGL